MDLELLLKQVAELKASDLYLSANNSPVLRINGELKPIDQNCLNKAEIREMLYSVMSKELIQEFERNKDLDFAIDLENIGRFRVNCFETINGPAGVFRFIPPKISSIDELNLPQIIKSICSLSKGLILVTGPTGSGKTTTLAAMIDHLNRFHRKHIITIEDPIEFIHKSQLSLINQRQVHEHTKSFSSALKGALRETPDVILVGELRDFETIQLALTAAETGHLVLATLHTNSAAKAIDRIIDVFPAENKDIARTMLAGSLQAVVTQLLTKTVTESKRIAIHEILIANSAIRNLIRENKIPQIVSAMQMGKKSGMQTFKDATEDLLAKRMISMDQAKLILNEMLTNNVDLENNTSKNQPSSKVMPEYIEAKNIKQNSSQF